ncbi:hypothetical protein RRG08_034690 [Elysia crispata]|uniref:PKS/mFAS DH domain-containing protein n=1 Tax=Elysia crispata TaxID=231223 RepID=A0AAE0Z116_9GAST|nr:hypothetical protein RRG08_034690 [Elysia crispata]
MNLLKVYPPIQYPVSRGTPLLSSLVAQAWDHSVEWVVPKAEDYELGSGSSSADTSYEIDVSDSSPDQYLADHQVDGRALFPACGCLVLAWQTLASLKGVDFQQMRVRLSNVQIHQAMFLPTSGSATVKVSVMPKTGDFQVCENENILASGVVTSPEGPCLKTEQYLQRDSVLKDQPVAKVLNRDEVYRELICRGYEYGHYFQGVQRSSIEGLDSDILWDGRWISFLDAVLQMILLGNPDAFQALPVTLGTISIDPTVHPAPPEEESEAETIPGHYDRVLDIVAAGGVEMRGIRTILKDYADACLELSRQITLRWLEHDTDNVLLNRRCLMKCKDYLDSSVKKSPASASYSAAKALVESILKQRNGHSLPDNSLHRYESRDKDFVNSIRPKIHDGRFDALDDPVFSTLESDEIIKLCFDTVANNTTTNTMNILEAGAIKSTFFRRAFPKALEHFTYKNYRYCIADKFIVDDAIKFPVKMLMFDTNDASSFPDTHRESFDLLILKNHLHTHNDLDLAFTAYSEMIKPGGFILVEEQVERLPLLYPFESLVSPWICDGKAGPEGERILGCYYTESRWRAFFGRHGFQEIIHRADGMASAIFLLRKGVEVATPPCIMNVNDLQCSWLEDVKARYRDLQGQPEDARLWLVATEENSGIWGLVQSIRWESGSEKVRCVHVSNRNPESKVPKLAADSAEFKELMKKDLVNNVYRDGRWGTYKTMVIHEDATLTERLKAHVFADCYVLSDPLSLKWFDSPLNVAHHNR